VSELAAKIAATEPPAPVVRDGRQHPTGFEHEWDGREGWIGKALEERPRTWDDLIREADLDPEEVEVVGDPQIRGWDAAIGGGQIKRMRYFRINVRRRTLRTDLDELVKAAKRVRRSVTTEQANTDSAFMVALGDLQIGKADGDGVEGTVQRFLDTTTAAVQRYKRIAKGAAIYLLHLGDCIEGMVSQGGANTWRTTLTTTEQVRLYRRLVIEQVKALSAVTPRLVVAGVPGNHDEAHRPLHTYGDSWAIDSLAAVRDALDLAGTYEHVTVHTPARDELTLTLDVCGTIVGLAHGHQWRAGQHVNWWAKQAHGRQDIGDAHLLLSGHLHHLRVEQTGSDKTFLQVPALESGSQWWKHRTGEWGQPGIVTALVGGGTWRSLEVL
jgi:predicted phosphodiesterase